MKIRKTKLISNLKTALSAQKFLNILFEIYKLPSIQNICSNFPIQNLFLFETIKKSLIPN